ncbi:hypothetical protein K0M31_019733 [Melipona bicolor]|uniref:Uncharacterized protein n=1 Tax=Melipona bicolor TaxID=60889 RepID=A0AA40KRC9_9HYME|nr:hypothetical protein K0M31_019733 [Melipona bicolor]
MCVCVRVRVSKREKERRKMNVFLVCRANDDIIEMENSNSERDVPQRGDRRKHKCESDSAKAKETKNAKKEEEGCGKGARFFLKKKMSCRAFQSFAISLISFERSMLDEREFRIGFSPRCRLHPVFTGIVETCHVEGKRALSASCPKFQ